MKYSHYDSKPIHILRVPTVAPTKFTGAFAWASPPKSKLAAPYESGPSSMALVSHFFRCESESRHHASETTFITRLFSFSSFFLLSTTAQALVSIVRVRLGVHRS